LGKIKTKFGQKRSDLR